jgi:molecular chaperone GrpE
LEEAEEVLEVEEHKDNDKDYIERLQRLQAEFENFQKRVEKEKQENLVNANEKLISQLLEVLDDFELSLKHNKDEGVNLIYNDLNKILKKQGLKSVISKGKFNPKIHEVLMQEDGEEEGIILQEFQKGYLLNDKLLRASKVKISKKNNK